MVLLMAALTMVLGGAVTFFLLFHTRTLDFLKPSRLLAPMELPSERLGVTADMLPASPRLMAPPPPRLQQHLSPQDNEVEEIIDLLRTGYLEPSTILMDRLDAEALRQLVEADDRYVRLSVEPVLSTPRQGVAMLETLPGDVAYWRPLRLDADAVRALVRQWSVWKTAPVSGLVVDLRFFRDGNQFAGAASAAGLFVSPDTPLFTLQELGRPQKVFLAASQPLEIRRGFPVLVLINGFTRGAGEVLADMLVRHSGALLVGQTTAGEGGLYVEHRLKTGRHLRLASQRVYRADGVDMLGRPLQPALPISSEVEQEYQVFHAAYSRSAAATIAEPQIVKSVSQLVAEGKGTEPTGMDQISGHLKDTDRVLQAAVDVIRALSIQRPDVPTLIEFEVKRAEEQQLPTR